MFDQNRLKDVLVQYKQDFVAAQWNNEKYKWEAVKWFQDNWDVNAPDFAEMLSRSLDKTLNLLVSYNNFPKAMIVSFAKSAPEEVRAMFIALFDESKDVFGRMDAFKQQSSKLLEARYGGDEKNHYQYENAISTYLWLRYPDKYYIYKFGEAKKVASALKSEHQFKKGAYADNIRNFLRLYDEINVFLKRDTELVNLFQSQLTETCYPDPELKTLTVDVGFYISRVYSKKSADTDTGAGLYGAGYNPGLSVDDWSKLLKDETVFTSSALEIMKRMKDYGGMATCTQLAVRYGETKNFYNVGSVALAKRVCESTGISPDIREDGSTRWWTVLYTGRDAKKDEEGSIVWKLRDELAEALDQADLSAIELYAAAASSEENPVTADMEIEPYNQTDFLDEVYMTRQRYESLVAVLRNKKNIILQGPPGVGKTFAARRLAWSIMEEKDDSRIEFVQFHQNYSYEDFMMGYKPVEDGFELRYGVFYRFCQKAANQPDKDFFFIIDEINRGNMSKIFGELLMLIEKDYRGIKATLAYNGLPFSVPENLYIIGMMNTADRSLAMIDYALRRRFSFFEMEPGFDSEGFLRHQKILNSETMDELIIKVKDLNHEIALDRALGKGFCIGHSYFCGETVCSDEWLRSIVEYDILPTLGEYWFDDANKLQRWANILQGVFQ
ncbi:MAG TPA: AAA domain-containing protein [Clostridiales bacterium]|nr:AAA domain-containing protein [Clostridiales bacterium]